MKTPTTPAPAIPADAGTAALAYYRREAVATPVATQAGSSDLDQMFGYYAA